MQHSILHFFVILHKLLGSECKFKLKNQNMEIFDLLKTGTNIRNPQQKSSKKISQRIKISNEVEATLLLLDPTPNSNVNKSVSKISIRDPQIQTDATVTDPRQYMNQRKIKITGHDSKAILPIASFDSLFTQYTYPNKLSDNVRKMFTTTPSPTPIQASAWPAILSGKDCMCIAPTGSGKTLAFLLPLLQLVKRDKEGKIKALIIAPTRELSIQIHKEMMRLSAGMKVRVGLLDGRVVETSLKERKKTDILVTTPLKLVHGIQEGYVDLRRYSILISLV